MAFVRPKTIHGNTYYYLVETQKRKQVVKKYLGKQVPAMFMPLFRKRRRGYF